MLLIFIYFLFINISYVFSTKDIIHLRMLLYTYFAGGVKVLSDFVRKKTNYETGNGIEDNVIIEMLSLKFWCTAMAFNY